MFITCSPGWRLHVATIFRSYAVAIGLVGDFKVFVRNPVVTEK